MSDLNEFLVGEDAQPAPPVPVAEEGAGAASPAAPASAADVDPAAGTPAADGADTEENEPQDGPGLIQALQATRRDRADHKGRADRAEGELAALKAQLAEARKAPAVPAVPAAPAAAAAAPSPMEIPNPVEDPQAYVIYNERMRFNDRLNTSEAHLRRELGAAGDVDAMVEVFRKAAAANPALGDELYRQIDPYRWLYGEAKRIVALEEIGPDPVAYRAKIAAEERAKLLAEGALGGGAGGAGDGAGAGANGAGGGVVLPNSLGTMRSASPRLQAVTPAPEFADIFTRRKRA